MIRNTQPEDVGVIAPYRDQVEKIACQLGIDEIEIDTVHKFQGREKDTIVLTTVDDVITAFSDDPYLLNVAVSQAKKRLILVASGMEQPPNSNIGELIDFWTVMKHVRAFHQILILTPCYNMRLCEMLCRNMQLYWLCNKIAGSC